MSASPAEIRTTLRRRCAMWLKGTTALLVSAGDQAHCGRYFTRFLILLKLCAVSGSRTAAGVGPQTGLIRATGVSASGSSTDESRSDGLSFGWPLPVNSHLPGPPRLSEYGARGLARAASRSPVLRWRSSPGLG